MNADPGNEQGATRPGDAPNPKELLGEDTTTAANGKAKVKPSISELAAAVPMVDFYRSAESPEPEGAVRLDELIDAIRTGKFKAKVERVRELVATGDADAVSAAKKKLNAISVSGCINDTAPPRRAKAVAEGRFEHNGLIQIDIDGKDNPDLVLDVRAMLIEDPRIREYSDTPTPAQRIKILESALGLDRDGVEQGYSPSNMTALTLTLTND